MDRAYAGDSCGSDATSSRTFSWADETTTAPRSASPSDALATIACHGGSRSRTLEEHERTEHHAHDRVRDRDRRDGGDELAGRERELLEQESDDPGGRPDPELEARDHVREAVGVEMLDHRLHHRRREAVEHPGHGPEHGGTHRQAAAVREQEQRGACEADHDHGDRPVCVGAVLDPGRGVAEGCEAGQADDDDRGSQDLASPDRLVRQEVAERERPDHRRHEEGLDDRDAAPVERCRLQDDSDDLHEQPEQPDPLPQEHGERERVPEGDALEVERRLLPERRSEREADGRGQREKGGDVVHGRPL
jgi:hypothetical protein